MYLVLPTQHFTLLTWYSTSYKLALAEDCKKIADAFGISRDYLVGEGKNAQYNKKTLQTIEDIEAIEPGTQDKLYFHVNAIIRDYKVR